jgi:hypothetical protein
MMFAYVKSFYDAELNYPAEQYHAPFFGRSPPMVGMSFVRTPRGAASGAELGMTGFSGTTGGGAFPTPTTAQRVWRYTSLNPTPSKGDGFCSLP